MHRLILIILCLIISPFLWAGCIVTTSTTCPFGQSVPGDGCANAPAGPAQYPTLLSSYKSRPAWNVAGVDYRVGYPVGTVFADPLTIPTSRILTGPQAGVSRSGNTIRCDGGYSGSTLDRYDFSLHGGFSVSVVTCTNFTVSNSNFAVGANCTGNVSAAAASPNLTVIYNVFDGGGQTTNCSSGVAETVTFSGAGTSILRYNHIKNVYQHFASFGGSINYPLMEYNLIEQCGFYQGAHCNGSQINGGTDINAKFNFNTYYSPQPYVPVTWVGLASTTAGLSTITIPTGVGFLSSGASNNSLAAGMSISGPTIPAGSIINGTPLSRTSGGAGCDANHPELCITTINIAPNVATATNPSTDLTVVAYPSGMTIDVSYRAQGGSTLTNGSVSNNVMVNTGPIYTVSYSIYCQEVSPGPPTNNVTGTTISGNYMDNTGAAGPFYENGTGGWCQPNINGNTYGSPLPNIDMKTGLALTP